MSGGALALLDIGVMIYVLAVEENEQFRRNAADKLDHIVHLEKVDDLKAALSRGVDHVAKGQTAVIEVITGEEPNYPTS